MALAFPLDLGEVLRMSSIRARLVGDQQMSGLGGGKIIVADLAPKYWEFDVTLITMDSRDAVQVQALIESLDEGLNDFYIYDKRNPYPASDPNGTLLGSSSVVIASLNANNKEITLSGLPASYVLTAGDMLAFDFGTPTKRALHRVIVGGTASSGGVSPSIEVRPHIRPGAVAGAAVTLIKASARAKIIPGSFDAGIGRQNITSGMGFKARQVIV